MDLIDYRRKIIANSPHLKSASGAVATFSDGADLPLKSLNVGIEPVQSGSGDPSPTNIRPISGRDGVKVTRCGKNLCPPLVDTELTSNGLTITPNSDGSVRVHGTATNTSAVLLRMKTVSIALRAGTYTFGIGVYPTNNKVYAQCIYSGGTLYARLAPRTISFNDTVTITRIDIGVNAASGENIDITLYPQLEKSSTETPYEPYNGVNVSIDLGQTVYGATLNPLTGVLTVDKGCDTFDGSSDETWNILSSDKQRISFRGWLSNAKKETATPITDMMTNSIPLSTTSENAFNNGKITCRGTAYQSVYVYIFVPPSEFNTIKQLRAYLADQPWQVVYPLATPFEIQLTPHQIRSLYGNNTIFADTGNVALEYWAHP